jgi:ATP/maltotriose-dependent transcriptional regulator MalT
MRLEEGKIAAASATVRRVLGEVAQPLARAELLPARVEIALAGGDLDGARKGCAELEEIARRYESDVIGALAAECRGAVALFDGQPQQALGELRPALLLWRDLGAPYEAARIRVLIGLCCRALGDEESAHMELSAARDVFSSLDARPDLARVDSLLRKRDADDAYGLTARERQVLALLAEGRSNREIAATLVISEHTAARHVQNIFGKLGVTSRAAAGAFAVAHELA